SYPAERLTFMCEDASLRFLLTFGHLQHRFSLPSLLPLCLDTDWPSISLLPATPPPVMRSNQQLAYIIYTSGSTGTPKGVQIQHASILRLVCASDYVPFDAHLRLLQLAPISFDAATFELWAPLLHGARCVLFPDQPPSIHAIGEALQQEAIT